MSFHNFLRTSNPLQYNVALSVCNESLVFCFQDQAPPPLPIKGSLNNTPPISRKGPQSSEHIQESLTNEPPEKPWQLDNRNIYITICCQDIVYYWSDAQLICLFCLLNVSFPLPARLFIIPNHFVSDQWNT